MNTLKILIVDDDEDYAHSLQEFIGLEGYEADVALTGEAGIRAVREKEYDQILLDVVLPDMNGAEGMRAIRVINGEAHIILMTGYSAGHPEQTVVDTGSAQVLTKPIDLDELSKRLAALQKKKLG